MINRPFVSTTREHSRISSSRNRHRRDLPAAFSTRRPTSATNQRDQRRQTTMRRVREAKRELGVLRQVEQRDRGSSQAAPRADLPQLATTNVMSERGFVTSRRMPRLPSYPRGYESSAEQIASTRLAPGPNRPLRDSHARRGLAIAHGTRRARALDRPRDDDPMFTEPPGRRPSPERAAARST